MGVAYLVNWPLPQGKSPTQAAELLHMRIEALGAKRSGTFTVDCETYQLQQLVPGTSNQIRDSRFVYVFHDSEHPLTVFSLTESGVVLVADSNFDSLMIKFKQLFVKKAAKIESKGLRFEWNDFLLKVGIVTVGPSVKGILLEVEYLPCAVLNDCRELINEVAGGILGTQESGVPPSKTNEVFHPKDKIRHYHEHFSTLRKQVGGASAIESNAK